MEKDIFKIAIKRIILVLLVLTFSCGISYAKDKTDDPERLYNAAEFFMRKGNYPKAIELYNVILKSTESAKIYKGLGYSYYKLNMYDKAINTLNNAVAIDPKIEDGRYYLALVYKELGQYDEAISQIQMGLISFPESPVLHTELGILYGKSGLYSQAIEEFKKALLKNPNNDRLFYYIGVSHYAKNDLPNSASYYLKALEQNPNYASAHKNLGAIYVLQNKNAEAISHLRSYIRLSPGSNDIDAIELQIKKLEEDY